MNFIRTIRGVLLPTAAMGLAIAAAAAPPTDFSGDYTLGSIQGGPQSAVGVWRLEVRQDDNNIELTTIQDGADTTNTCPFKRVGPYRDRNGEVGTCTAEWQKNDVVLQIFLRAPARPGQPPGRVHVRQVLRLSDDTKRLTLRTDRDSDRFPPDPNGGVEPLVEIYARD
jgi:hypothetical protein